MADENQKPITYRDVQKNDEDGICVISENYSPGYTWYVKDLKNGDLELHTKKDFSGSYRHYAQTVFF